MTRHLIPALLVTMQIACVVISPLSAFTLPEAGAEAPFATLFAADHAYRGELLESSLRGEIATEAVTRRAVRLNAVGDQVTMPAPRPFNAVTIRYAVPDAPHGGGIETSLRLAIGGEEIPIRLHSQYTWLYADNDGGLLEDPAILDNPGGFARHVFDELHVMLPREYPAGTEITLRKTTADTAAFYGIDLVDFELVPPPLPCPADALSVTDYGAAPDDDGDDTAAILACLAAAKKQNKNIYFPPGVFRQDGVVDLDNIAVSGAGMWHTILTTHRPPPENAPWSGNLGFRLQGENIRISNLRILGLSRRRGKPYQRGVSGSGRNFVLENLWIERCGTGIWIGDSRHGIVRNCRFRNNKADGINLNNHSHDIVVEHCHARGNGDDSFASFSNTDKGGGLDGPNRNIVFRRNTSESNWWGNGIGLYGGENQVAEYNLIRSAQPVSGINVSTGHSAWPMDGVTVKGNVIENSGGVNWNQRFGSIWVHAAGQPIRNATVADNIIRGGLYDAIKIQGGGALSVICTGNRIEQTTGHGILILGNARGEVTLRGNFFGSIGGSELSDQAGIASVEDTPFNRQAQHD